MGVSGRSASSSGRAIPSGMYPPVPIRQEAGWVSEKVWTEKLEEKSFANAGDRTLVVQSVVQPFAIFLPWRNLWNNFQVSGNPCIKIIISTAHGTLVWSVSCRYNNPIIIVNALFSREWYISVDLFILTNLLARSSKTNVYFFQSRSLAEPRLRNPGLDNWEFIAFMFYGTEMDGQHHRHLESQL
jgi:hypothetical protein